MVTAEIFKKMTIFMKEQKVLKFEMQYEQYPNDVDPIKLKLTVEWEPGAMEEMIVEKPKTEQEILQQELEDALRSV